MPTCTRVTSPARCATRATSPTGWVRRRRTKEIAEAIKGNEHYADSFNRMCDHLKDNGVDVGDNASTLTLGEWLTVDPVSEQFVKNDAAMKLWTREYRKPFVVPDIEREMSGQSAAAG